MGIVLPGAVAYADDSQPAHTITFSHDSLVGREPFFLTMNSQVGGVIHYTTNGAAPDGNSAVYQNALLIEKSTVIRAHVLDTGGNPVGGVFTKW